MPSFIFGLNSTTDLSSFWKLDYFSFEWKLMKIPGKPVIWLALYITVVLIRTPVNCVSAAWRRTEFNHYIRGRRSRVESLEIKVWRYHTRKGDQREECTEKLDSVTHYASSAFEIRSTPTWWRHLRQESVADYANRQNEIDNEWCCHAAACCLWILLHQWWRSP